ncbi:MAG: hypothetical protein IIV81_00380, partial [Clostridia bacterium]|nr:hypothetical protein [Clostridia bacterium]
DGKHAPLDFFSWHMYGEDVNEFPRKIRLVDEVLTKYGYGDIETSLNEWNYIYGWKGDEYTYSLNQQKALKGSSFVAGAMCVGQAEKLDTLMYYDARPCGFNGIFEQGTYRPFKTYYVYLMFRDLLHLGTHVPTEYANGNVYNVAATDKDGNYGMMVTYFNADDNAENERVCIEVENSEGVYEVECYALDENHDRELVRAETFTAKNYKIYLNMPVHSTYYVSIKKI